MFIIGHFINAVATILDLALTLYMWILIARAIISWVSPDPYNPIVRFLYSVTDPVLYRIRRIIPLYFGGIDFSPMLLILAIVFVQSFLINTLKSLAFRLM